MASIPARCRAMAATRPPVPSPTIRAFFLFVGVWFKMTSFPIGSFMYRSRVRAELFQEHVHVKPVVPNAVGAALVLPHDRDSAEAHPFVSADCNRVVGRRIDCKAMVAALLEEIPGEDPNRFCAQPLAVPGCGEKDVYARMAIHRLIVLAVLDRTDDLPIGLDDEAIVCLYELLADLLLEVNAAPPPVDFGFVSDLKQPFGVLGAAWTQQHALSLQNEHVDPTLLSGPGRRDAIRRSGTRQPRPESSRAPVNASLCRASRFHSLEPSCRVKFSWFDLPRLTLLISRSQ